MSELVGWEVTTWGTISDLRYGKALRDYRGAGGDVPVFGTNGPVGLTDSPQCSGPGVIIGRKGAYRGVHYSELPFWVIDTAFYLAPKSRIDMRWAYYSLQLADINGLDSGSAIPSTTRESFGAIAVLVPPLPEQQAIAEVLGALDDKIAANTALVATADALLATEFRTRLHQTEVHDRELTAIANVVLGGTPPRARPDYWTDGTIPWLNSGAVNATRIVEPSELITAEALANSAAKLMPNGATLLAITGATLGQIARLEMTASGNQSIVGVWSDDVNVNTWLYFAIQARLDDLLARATGAAQQHVSKGDVEQLAVPVPSQAVLEEFSSVATPLLELAATAERENRTLAATRDALLPQLMSGKLRVRDAERVASEVGA
ncbi:restriction endonuclease subunit S [Microbacterium lacticum]